MQLAMLTRISATAMALVLASASAVGAQDNDADIIDIGTGDAVVVPLNNSIAAVEPGDTQWVALTWTSLNADARNLKVTAVGSKGVTVEYPEFHLGEDSTFLVDARNDVVVRELVDGDTISTREFRQFTIEATTDGPASSVKFTVDGYPERVESHVPYLIASDWYGDFHPWNVRNGTYEVEATPYTEDYARGITGIAKTITITVAR